MNKFNGRKHDLAEIVWSGCQTLTEFKDYKTSGNIVSKLQYQNYDRQRNCEKLQVCYQSPFYYNSSIKTLQRTIHQHSFLLTRRGLANPTSRLACFFDYSFRSFHSVSWHILILIYERIFFTWGLLNTVGAAFVKVYLFFYYNNQECVVPHPENRVMPKIWLWNQRLRWYWNSYYFSDMRFKLSFYICTIETCKWNNFVLNKSNNNIKTTTTSKNKNTPPYPTPLKNPHPHPPPKKPIQEYPHYQLDFFF